MLENDTNQDVDELIRRGAQVEIPADVEERLRVKLAAFRVEVEHRPPSRLQAIAGLLLRPSVVRVAASTAALLLLIAAGFVLIPRNANANQVFAAAAQQLRSSQSLEYSIVFNASPYVGVDLSFLAPGFRRINCSWGIEIRADHSSGKQIVLMHATRSYLTENIRQTENLADSSNVVEELRSLPQAADEVLGEQWTGGRRLIGYRLRHPPAGTFGARLKEFDIWIDAGTREAHHAAITFQEEGKPAYQMQIQNIRAGGSIDRSVFDLIPPAGYTALAIPATGESVTASQPVALSAQIGRSAPFTAVVLPMQGSYLQTAAALRQVESYLKKLGVSPSGAPFGRYGSEQQWDAGYPVPPGTAAEAPFLSVELPETMTASATVKGAWAKDSASRWTAFLKSVVEQGYMPAGLPMEIWTGEDSKEWTQSTEMRIPVAKPTK